MNIQMKLNSKDIYINGVKTKSDVEPIAKNGRTLVPIRMIAELFGIKVEWKQKTQEVLISNRRKYFDEIDNCAADWAMYFNALSTALYVELSGIIYYDENGYFWDNVRIGETQSAHIPSTDIRKGVAAIHSHGGNKPDMTKQMSNADKKIARMSGCPLYMVDSGGTLWVYTSGNRNQEKVMENLVASSRWCDVSKTANIMNKYFKDGYFGLSDEYPFGFVADYYNRLYMHGIGFDNAGNYKNIKKIE